MFTTKVNMRKCVSKKKKMVVVCQIINVIWQRLSVSCRLMSFKPVRITQKTQPVHDEMKIFLLSVFFLSLLKSNAQHCVYKMISLYDDSVSAVRGSVIIPFIRNSLLSHLRSLASWSSHHTCRFNAPPQFHRAEIEQVFQVEWGYSEQSEGNFLKQMWQTITVVPRKKKSRSFLVELWTLLSH